jgi:hypothetical protein
MIEARSKKIDKCRICGNTNLIPIISLGDQAMTGIFPAIAEIGKVPVGPINLVKCHGVDVCGLLQLENTFDPIEMYGNNYGYRSGLNQKMIDHLHSKVKEIFSLIDLKNGDMVIDIGSNDGTSLAAYPDGLELVGIDPTAEKFRKYYQPRIKIISDFFSSNAIINLFGKKKARVVTSHSMMYDLDDPIWFAKEVRSILEEDGVWIFEQSYMPLMLSRTAYDTICHEHIEYYSLKQIVWILEKADLKVVDVSFNDTNGGSFSVVATPIGNDRLVSDVVNKTLLDEDHMGLNSLEPFLEFAERTKSRATELLQFIEMAISEGKTIRGVGASTKGNCLLQFTGLGSNHVLSIAEINTEKFGCVTPGSHIKIENQQDVLDSKSDYLLVLPWHFKDFFLNSPLFDGQNLLFPLPNIEVISR